MADSPLQEVKLDNWGVFFLQRLHQLFIKGEHCDLVLSFKNAEKIQVHRIVLHSCTDYFQTLEKSSSEDSSKLLQMPDELDPEVVVPIVNFMYTGRLQFRLELQSRLYSTAKILSMTVLTKLLDAQHNAMSLHTTQKGSSVRKNQMPVHGSWNYPIKKVLQKQNDTELPETLPGRKLPIWKRRNTMPNASGHTEDKTSVFFTSPLLLAKNGSTHEDVSGPMRFDWPDDELKQQPYNPSFDDLSYETKPIIKPTDTSPKTTNSQSTSHCLANTANSSSINPLKKEVQRVASFEEVRRTAVAVKRPSYSDSAGTTPEKQPKMVDLQAVKEYVQEHQLRKDLVEVEDSGEDVEDDLAVADYDDDDDDCEEDAAQMQDSNSVSKTATAPVPSQPAKSILKTQAQISPDSAASSNSTTQAVSPPKRVRFALASNTESSKGKENEAKVDTNVADITSPSSISNSDEADQSASEEYVSNHAKIITEVLKKYPHLVKNKKNIKLKILKKGPGGSHFVAKDIADGKGLKSKISYVVLKSEGVGKGSQLTGSIILKHGNILEPLSELPSSLLEAAGSGVSTSTSAGNSSTIISVSRPIASGAENTTGPWLCYSCGTEGTPLNFETYYTYRRHLQDVHMEKIDARICEHCGHRASKRNLLLYHLYTRHNVAPPRNCQFPRCDQCDYVALSESLLIKHRNNHTNNREFVCKVCNATFKSNGALQGHIQANLHSDPAKKNYECPICHKPFVRNINLKAHLRSAHADVAKKVEKEEPESEASENNEHANNCMLTVQQSKAGSVLLNPGVTVLASGSTGPVQTLVPSSEAEAFSNVASGIAASLGLSTDTLHSDQTVIVLDGNSSEFILGSAGDTEVQEYVEEPMVHTDTQEYIVPEILTGDDVHPYDGTVVTTAAGSSFSTIVQRPTLNPPTVAQPVTVADTVNTNGLGVVIADHDYANEVALRGIASEGMMFIITPGPNGNTILQTGHIATQQSQHTDVYTHQITQQLQQQFVQQQKLQLPSQPQIAQQELIENKHTHTLHQQKPDHKSFEQHLSQLQQQNLDHQLLPPDQSPGDQNQQQEPTVPQEQQQQTSSQKVQEQHLPGVAQHRSTQEEKTLMRQQLFHEQLLQQQTPEQSVSRKDPIPANSGVHQQLINDGYLVESNTIGQEISCIIANECVTSTTISVSHDSTTVAHTGACRNQCTQDTTGRPECTTTRTELDGGQQNSLSGVDINHDKIIECTEDKRVKENVELETGIAVSVAQVPVFVSGNKRDTAVQSDDSSRPEIEITEMQSIVIGRGDPGCSTDQHMTIQDVNEARRMASDIVKEWDEFDDDSCDFVGTQLAQKNKEQGNRNACVS